MEGTPFGRYRLIELLGRGGMGEVWRAHDTTIDRVVAIKMLLPHYAEDSDFDKRFRREARAAARLDDPHVVPIYDVGEVDGRLFVAMRLINGTDLHTLLGAGPLEPARAVHIVEQIASALHSAHRSGLVHRDVKPSNILLATDDFAYLIDFGIARSTGDTALTSANTTIGTWAYMAPERFRSGEIQPSSDIYALACVLYECLTGHPPYQGDTLEQVAVGHMVMPPPRASEERATVPIALDQVITVGLAKQPADRYPTAIDLAAAARQAIAGTAPPVWPDAAQTQQWKSDHVAPQFDPAYAGEPVPWPLTSPTHAPSPPGVGATRRRVVLIVSLAVVGLLVLGGVIAAVNLSDDDSPSAATPSSTSTSVPAAPNTGPFTGTYRADFGPISTLGGVADPSGKSSKATYGLRSVCRPTGCVATGSRLSGDPSFAPTVVFDEVNGIWLSVSLASQQCRENAGAESWQVFKLRPARDGTLTGEFTATAGNSCSAKHTVTFTRTADVDVGSLPDPANLTPRVVSPAEALFGRYHQARTFTNGQKQESDFVVATDCLRSGDRCMSFFHEASGLVEPLVFADGKWSLGTDIESTCPGMGAIRVKKTGQYPLPQPLQNPVTLLTGHGNQEQSPPCPVTIVFDETFTRTGD
ncbi:serine/threonine-protein kinase [Mycobacterium sp. NPDC048908]|uniref:serine/threonine-protein kinase n=1 Tax=Mycobacterium sp. NPDC048908 TaxID=3364292 RepID=UPI00371A87A4